MDGAATRSQDLRQVVACDSAAPSGDVLGALAELVAAKLEQPRRIAWNLAEAAEKLGCKASWLEEQARRRKIPYTRLSGAYHFTDAHLKAAAAAFEVTAAPPPRPEVRAAAPSRARKGAERTEPQAPPGFVELVDRPPRKRRVA